MLYIHVIALGGTIASTASASPAPTGPAATPAGVTPNLSAQALAAAAGLDSLPDAPQLSFTQLAQVGSGSITLEHLFAVIVEARAAAQRGVHGIVVTQGTDTLEDSAFVLSLLNDSGIPIVVTGAMRHPDLPGADGPANLAAAVRVASDPHVRALAHEAPDEKPADPQLRTLPRLASLVVCGDTVFDPLFCTKRHTTLPGTFAAPAPMGALGWVHEDRVTLAHIPAARSIPQPWRVPSDHRAVTEHVALIEAGLGDELNVLPQLASTGYAGVVIAGVGGGHVAEFAVSALATLARTLPVVLAARPGAGASLEQTYGYPGGEIDLLSRGAVTAGPLQARQARLALMLALHFGTALPHILHPVLSRWGVQ